MQNRKAMPSCASMQKIGLVSATDADRGQKVFVKLHPHGVIGVATGRGEPGPVVADSVQGVGQALPVPCEAGDDLSQPYEERTDPFVESVESLEDLVVIGAIRVVVGLVSRLQLPVGADTKELGVQDEEPVVRAPGDAFWF